MVRAAPADDRGRIEPGDLVLLLIDDDPSFAQILMNRARDQGFRVVIAADGAAGLALARDLLPTAVLLDISLPGMNGWSILDRFKHDPAIWHIPVHIVSVTEDDGHCALRLGARGYLQKTPDLSELDELLGEIRAFAEHRERHLLIVEDDQTQASSLIQLLGGDDVHATVVASGEEAITALRQQHVDCMVLDLILPGMSGIDLLEKMRRDPKLRRVPVVIYTARDVSAAEQAQLSTLAEAVIIKDVSSPERLLLETSLFLHRADAELAPEKRRMLEQARQNDPALAGTQVLIIDDDVRNVFALTAALEHRYGMNVMYAENGVAGIDKLRSGARVDVILMDVMMPGIDGYETMRRIRQLPQFESIPIVALTAKAMKGDREKCVAAGASDYIAKPVDTDQLASLIRIWVGERKCGPEQRSR